jgi:hypothetical protein
MDQYWRDALEGLKETAQHLTAASQEIAKAGTALTKTAEAVIHAKNEHEDLRETVHRLETLVLQLVDEVRQLRERSQE